MLLIVGRYCYLQIKAIGVSCLFKQFLSLVDIGSIYIIKLFHVILTEGREHTASDRCTLSVSHEIHNLLLVNRIAECLTNSYIIKGLYIVIKVYCLNQIHCTFKYIELV